MSKFETHRQEQGDPEPMDQDEGQARHLRTQAAALVERLGEGAEPVALSTAPARPLTPEAFAKVAADVALDLTSKDLVKPWPEDEARAAGAAAALKLLREPRKALELIAGLVALLPRDDYSRPELRLPMSPEAVALLLSLGGKATKTMVTPSRIAEGAELELGGLQVVASAPMRPLTAEDLPAPELHRCAVSTCPGLPYRASEFAHPCREPAPKGSAS